MIYILGKYRITWIKFRFVDPHFPPDDISLFADPTQKLGANSAAQQTFRCPQALAFFYNTTHQFYIIIIYKT